MKKTIFLIGNTRANRTLMQKSSNSKMLTRYIILTLGVVTVHQVIATLDMPNGILERGARAKEISDAAAVSTFLTIPPATITALNLLITIYNNATTSNRVSAYNKLLKALKSLMATFQTAADVNVDNAIALIESAKFGVKKITVKQKQVVGAKNGDVAGTIIITAPGSGAHTCHDWMYSIDGITFTRMPPTVKAETLMAGLTPGKYAYFTHELVTKKGGQGVSQIIKIMVK